MQSSRQEAVGESALNYRSATAKSREKAKRSCEVGFPNGALGSGGSGAALILQLHKVRTSAACSKWVGCVASKSGQTVTEDRPFCSPPLELVCCSKHCAVLIHRFSYAVNWRGAWVLNRTACRDNAVRLLTQIAETCYGCLYGGALWHMPILPCRYFVGSDST